MLLQQAILVLHECTFFTASPENPFLEVYAELADQDGKMAFKAYLEHSFTQLIQPAPVNWVG